jgi:hypothetical protein
MYSKHTCGIDYMSAILIISKIFAILLAYIACFVAIIAVK